MVLLAVILSWIFKKPEMEEDREAEDEEEYKLQENETWLHDISDDPSEILEIFHIDFFSHIRLKSRVK